jgi:hypothetical protein
MTLGITIKSDTHHNYIHYNETQHNNIKAALITMTFSILKLIITTFSQMTLYSAVVLSEKLKVRLHWRDFAHNFALSLHI